MATLMQKYLILILKETVTKLQRNQDFRESSTGANITQDIKLIFNQLFVDQSFSQIYVATTDTPTATVIQMFHNSYDF